MDYKELIDKLERAIYEVGDSVNRYSDGADEVIQSAATAIETLLAEREDILCELAAVADCTSCKFYAGGHPECDECGDFNRNWQWRGPQKEAQEPEQLGFVPNLDTGRRTRK